MTTQAIETTAAEEIAHDLPIYYANAGDLCDHVGALIAFGERMHEGAEEEIHYEVALSMVLHEIGKVEARAMELYKGLDHLSARAVELVGRDA